MPFVANTPIAFVFVCKAAGFIAGSIPIKGTLKRSRRTLIALVVAVLQATTISLQPLLNKNSVFLILSSIILASPFGPYGACLLSAK